MRRIALIALLLAPAAPAENVEFYADPALSIEDLLTMASMQTGEPYLYAAEAVGSRTVGSKVRVVFPKAKYERVIRFVLDLAGLEIRSYEGLFVVFGDRASTARFACTGLDMVLEFSRPPAGWANLADSAGSLNAKTTKALVARAMAPKGKDRATAISLLGVLGARRKDIVDALRDALEATDKAVSLKAAKALGRHGHGARPALPKLKTLAKTLSGPAQKSVQAAIARIEGAVDPALLDPTLANEAAPDSFKVRFETTKGDFTVEFIKAWAPHGVRRVYNLVRIGYYEDVAFFRAVKGFVVQFGLHGQPKVTGAWRTANLLDDPVKESNQEGTVTFAKTGRPNSRSIQLFISTRDNSRLDNMGFAPVGRVIDGMEVVRALHDGYGEKPNQERIRFDGNAYLKRHFPNLDYIRKATILK